MVNLLEDAPLKANATFFAKSSMAKKKTAETEMGRPRAIPLDPEQFEVIAKAMRDAAAHLSDVAKFMRENSLEKLLIPAAKVIDEHLPAVQSFSRRAWAEVGPAATANLLGRKTRIEINQEKHAKQKARKDSP